MTACQDFAGDLRTGSRILAPLLRTRTVITLWRTTSSESRSYPGSYFLWDLPPQIPSRARDLALRDYSSPSCKLTIWNTGSGEDATVSRRPDARRTLEAKSVHLRDFWYPFKLEKVCEDLNFHHSTALQYTRTEWFYTILFYVSIISNPENFSRR